MLSARTNAVRPTASPAVAALPFVVPGLGQGSLGALGWGVLLATPAAVVFVGAVGRYGHGGPPTDGRRRGATYEA